MWDIKVVGGGVWEETGREGKDLARDGVIVDEEFSTIDLDAADVLLKVGVVHAHRVDEVLLELEGDGAIEGHFEE